MYPIGRGPRGKRPARRAVRYLQASNDRRVGSLLCVKLKQGPRPHHFVVGLNGHLLRKVTYTSCLPTARTLLAARLAPALQRRRRRAPAPASRKPLAAPTTRTHGTRPLLRRPPTRHQRRATLRRALTPLMRERFILTRSQTLSPPSPTISPTRSPTRPRLTPGIGSLT